MGKVVVMMMMMLLMMMIDSRVEGIGRSSVTACAFSLRKAIFRPFGLIPPRRLPAAPCITA
jgi:hypothetical protein